MPHLSELHGAATHLAVVGVPLYALLLVLRRLGMGGAAARTWEPWALGATTLGVATSGLTGLLVKGQSETELRGSAYGIGGIHFWLGIALGVGIVVLVLRRWRGGAWVGLAVLAVAAVFVQGYLGGRMTYEHGVGVQALGQARQSATGASALHVALAGGMPPAKAGEQAFSDLGCASCHGDGAQGARGPQLAGGRDLDDFRRVHAAGLFPPAVVNDRDFATINRWLKTLDRSSPR